MLRTQSGLGLASTFIEFRQGPGGLGLLPTYSSFDPTPSQRVHTALRPSNDEISRGDPKQIFILQHFAESHTMFPKSESSTTQIVYNSYAAKFGFSVPDGACVMHANSSVLFGAICEVNGGEASPLAATLQGVARGTNIVVNMIANGVAVDDVIVPIISIAGRLIQFGAMFALESCFPVYMPVSFVLDLADDRQAALAAAHFEKARSVVKRSEQLLQQAGQTPKIDQQIELDLSSYHVKVLDDEQLQRGFSMFGDIDKGLEHMIVVYNKLYVSSAREYIVFPLSLRTADKENTENTENTINVPILIFPDLAQAGFRIGTPEFRSDEKSVATRWRRYMSALDQDMGGRSGRWERGETG